jgi:hypothetical protein
LLNSAPAHDAAGRHALGSIQASGAAFGIGRIGHKRLVAEKIRLHAKHRRRVSLRSAPQAFQRRSVNLVTFAGSPIELFIVALRGMVQMERRFDMNSQEELAACLRQLTEALAKTHHARRFSIVRDGDKPQAACADSHDRGQDAVTAPKPATVV